MDGNEGVEDGGVYGREGRRCLISVSHILR